MDRYANDVLDKNQTDISNKSERTNGMLGDQRGYHSLFLCTLQDVIHNLYANPVIKI